MSFNVASERRIRNMILARMPITAILLICRHGRFRLPMAISRGVSSGFGESSAQCFECTEENGGGQWTMKLHSPG